MLRILLIMIFICGELTSISLTAHAEEEKSPCADDKTPPVVDMNSFQVYPKVARPGDAVTLKFKVTDDCSGVNADAGISMADGPYGPAQESLMSQRLGSYDVTTQTVTTLVLIGKWTPPGPYHFSMLSQINDLKGNSMESINIPLSSSSYDVNFEVVNPDVDDKPPVIDLNSIEVSAKRVQRGKNFKFSFNVTDDRSGLDSAEVGIKSQKEADSSISWHFYFNPPQYDEKSKKMLLTGEVSKNVDPGVYTFTSIYVIDNAKNNTGDINISHLNLAIEVLADDPATDNLEEKLSAKEVGSWDQYKGPSQDAGNNKASPSLTLSDKIIQDDPTLSDADKKRLLEIKADMLAQIEASLDTSDCKSQFEAILKAFQRFLHEKDQDIAIIKKQKQPLLNHFDELMLEMLMYKYLLLEHSKTWTLETAPENLKACKITEFKKYLSDFQEDLINVNIEAASLQRELKLFDPNTNQPQIDDTIRNKIIWPVQTRISDFWDYKRTQEKAFNTKAK